MQKITCRLTVYFQDPFWVGVYERAQDGRLEACKITFGAEPKDYQVHQLLLQHWHRLRFSPGVALEKELQAHKNPKRMQRDIARQLAGHGTGTKSQQALKLQQKQGKASRKQRGREQREAEKQRQYQLRQQKKKEKKRGH